MSLDITVTDLFCGAGGSSIGAEAAGARLKMAANHWPLAIETHNTNFPNADHDCADVSQVNPRRYPSTDILIASPECTNHSSAKSKTKATIWDPYADAEEERSRATMWDIPRFAEAHRYAIVIVENVVEATKWAPYESWLMAMDALGYEHKQVFINSMVAHPTPQSRDRLYVVFWRRGNKPPNLDIRPVAHCPADGDVHGIQSWKKPNKAVGKYRTQYVYRCPICAGQVLPYAWPAAAAIDWNLPAPRIGDRDRPLAPATMRRIEAGLERYGMGAIVQAAGHTFERPGYHRTWPLWQPLGTQTTTIQHGLVVDMQYDHKPRSTDDPHNALTAQARAGLLVGINYQHAEGQVKPVMEPAPTQTAQQGHALLVPMRQNGRAHPPSEPIGTQVATASVHGLLVPLRTHGNAQPIGGSPMPTLVAGNPGHALLMRNNSGGAEMVTPTDEPAGTLTSAGHQSLLMPYNHTGPAYPVDMPHRTMDTRDRYALVNTEVDVMECGFRMLEPHEVGLAMAFPESYTVLGTKRERVRQYGNAVTPPVMDILLRSCIESLA